MLLTLASASPRRLELLSAAGFNCVVRVPDIEEVPAPEESASAYTLRVARAKARQVATIAGPDALVVGADTEVVADCRILGKPHDHAHAATILRGLSGQVHEVLTAVVVIRDERERAEVVTTRVRFAPLTDAEIDDYVATGEPMGKAGAYAIQGYGARFIEHIDGSWSNVVGLPIATVYRLVRGLE